MTNEQSMEERVEDWHASFSNLLFTQSVVGFLKDRMLKVGGKEGDLVWKVHVIYSIWISASLSSFNYQICTSSCFMKKKKKSILQNVGFLASQKVMRSQSQKWLKHQLLSIFLYQHQHLTFPVWKGVRRAFYYWDGLSHISPILQGHLHLEKLL